jgi:Rieske Fe-S protein
MDRRNFVIKSCKACLGAGLLSTLASGCSSAFYVSGTLEEKGISVSSTDFSYTKNDKVITRAYILVQNDKLEFPIYLLRENDQYTALYMKCTHQGSELNAAGDHLYCSSHGSEFDKKGNVTQGPAEKKLRSFPVRAEGNKITIDLS